MNITVEREFVFCGERGYWASNLLLFATKLGAGLWANSISIISDAFNNTH